MSILDIEIKSAFKFRFMFLLSAVLHFIFLLVFFFNELYVLVLINVVSVLFYLIGSIRSKGTNIEKNGMGWTISVYAEICFHAVFCTLWLGFEPCFYLYAIIAVVIVSYVLYLANEKEKFLKIIIPLFFITFAFLIGCFIYLLFNEPICFTAYSTVLTRKQIALMRGINIFFCTGIIFFFSIMFIMEMNVLIKKLNSTNEQLNYIAMHDALTGLYNRYSIYELVKKHRILSDIHDGSESDEKPNVDVHPYCVIMGDIDDFKKINDAYGHDCGDAVLKEVANLLSANVKEEDLICRWGGEEFLVIMHGKKQECVDVIQNLLIQINANRVHSEGYIVKVTMTFGLAFCGELTEVEKTRSVSDKIDALARIADERLYQGKNSGKNKLVSE